MRFRVAQDRILEALNRVAPTVPTKSTLPILSNMLFNLEGNMLRIVATDLEVSVVTELEVDGERDGSVTAPAKKIQDIVRELEGLVLTCDVDENNHLHLETEIGQYQLLGSSAQEFPALPEFEGATTISFGAEKFLSIITRTVFAVSRDELRPALTGVFFQIRSHELRAVATDGHRLVRIIDQKFESESEHELIIPVKALDIIRRNLPEAGDVEFAIGENQIQVKLPDTILYSRLIEGRYPHYESVIPSENNNRMFVSTDQLVRSLKRAQIFANPINRQVVLNLETDKVEITAEDIELGGKGREQIAAKYEGEPQTIGYNASYLLDLLKHITTEDVRFDLGGSKQAGIVKPTIENEGEDFLMLIMPVRLS
ncbi:DNA polymerase III subunit beta [bacterium BMS3Bbin04]|nr:DNA polymerase III subunit beta [bacterium BMS3Bbin04]